MTSVASARGTLQPVGVWEPFPGSIRSAKTEKRRARRALDSESMNRDKLTRLRLAGLALLVLALATSCGTIRFNREWKRVEVDSSIQGFAGRWKGSWTSELNGHSLMEALLILGRHSVKV